MTLPNFIVIGTRKAGTTSLYHYLEQHPQVYMSTLKGTRFFHFDPEDPERGAAIPVKSLETYQGYFEPALGRDAVAIGEASPTYFYDAAAAHRMRSLIPDVRLIVSLRNPVDRAYSEYLMHARNQAGAGSPTPSSDAIAPHLDSGFYAEHLRRYVDLFGTEQVLVLIFEEWIRDIPTTIQRLYRYLQVDDSFLPDLELQYNKGGVPRNSTLGSLLKHRNAFVKMKPYVPARIRSLVNRVRNSNMVAAPPLPPAIRAELAERFADDIVELERLLERDLSVWKPDVQRASASA